MSWAICCVKCRRTFEVGTLGVVTCPSCEMVMMTRRTPSAFFETSTREAKAKEAAEFKNGEWLVLTDAEVEASDRILKLALDENSS